MAAVRDIVIAGGGVAGWLSALVLGRALAGGGQRITLVETGGPDHGLGPIGPALTLFPGAVGFLADLGLDERLLIARARASYSLGSAFSDSHDWFLPYGETGAPIGPVGFHHLVARLRRRGAELRLADYSLAALAAQAGRFAHPSEDPRSILSTLEYGLHVERAALAALLRERAAPLVALAATPFGRAVQDEDGEIRAIALADGSRIDGDLFLDCTGPARLLIGPEVESWAQWFPCDRAVEQLAAVEGTPPPYAHAGAHEAGWQVTVPLQGGQGQTLLYSSAHLDAGQVGGRSVPFECGRARQVWRRNVIALGAAAALFEPLHPVAPQLLIDSLRRLITLFPGDKAGGPEAAEYERLTSAEIERTRDFLVLHGALDRREGEAFRDAARAAPLPGRLRYTLDLYASRGALALHDGEVFETSAWIAALDGLGMRPRRYDALADEIPEEKLRRHFERLREAIIAGVKQMPGHGAWLAQVLESAA